MKKLIITTCFLFIGSIALFAQQSISGKVVSTKNNSPVPYVHVKVTGSFNDATAADSEGNFNLKSDNSFDSVTVSSIGYVTKTISVKGKTGDLTITMKPATTSLKAVTVQSERFKQNTQDIATLDEMDLKRASTGLGLKQALNTIPGVEMLSRTPFGGQRISIRGYVPNAGKSANFSGYGYTLFIDGIPITDASGTTIMDAIDYSNLGKVEVIKGPSGLYANNIGGTVLLHSKKPKNGTSLSEQVIAGSNGLFRTTTRLQSAGKKMDFSLTYGHQEYESFRENNDSKKDFATFTTHYYLSERQTVTAYFSYANSHEGLAGELDSADFYSRRAISAPKYVLNNGKMDVEGYRIGFSDNVIINDHFQNNTSIFAMGSTKEQNFAHGFTDYLQQGYGLRTDFIYHGGIKSVGVTGHIGGMFQKTKNNTQGVFVKKPNLAPFTPSMPQIPNSSENYFLNYYAFTQWSFRLPRNYTLTVGGNINFNEVGIRDMLYHGSGKLKNQIIDGTQTAVKVYEPVFSPKVSLLKEFNEHFSAYSNFSQGLTPPLTEQIMAKDGSINLDLKAERGTQYEIGAHGKLLNNKLNVQLAIYDLIITDRLSTHYVDDIAYTTNLGKVENKGVGLQLDYDIINDKSKAISLFRPWIRYNYSDYTYADFKRFDADVNGQDSVIADYTGNQLASVAPHKLTFGLDLASKYGFYLNVKYRYNDKMPITSDNLHYIKAYSLLSAKLGYRKKIGKHFEVEAFVGGMNLTNETYPNMVFIYYSIKPSTTPIVPAPYNAEYYGSLKLKYIF